MKRIGFLCLLSGFLLAGVIPAQAGMLVEVKTTYPYAGTQTNQTFQIQKDKVRINLDTQRYNTAFIYRRDLKRVWMLNYENKTYLEFTLEKINQARTSIDSKLKKLLSKKTLNNAEKAQLHQLKLLQQNLKETNSVQDLNFKLIDKSKASNGWNCALYDGFRGYEKILQISTVDSYTLGFIPDEIKTLMDLRQFSFLLSGQVSGISNLLYQSNHFKGLVVKSESYKNQKFLHGFEVMSVRHSDFKDSDFDLPSGFTQNGWNPLVL